MKHPEATTSTAGRGGRRRGAEASSGAAPSRCRKGQALAAAPSLPLGLRQGAGQSRLTSHRLASPLAGPSRRLRHAPRFPEQPARLHLRAVAAERRPHAHHEVGAGREVRRAPAAWALSAGAGGRHCPRRSLAWSSSCSVFAPARMLWRGKPGWFGLQMLFLMMRNGLGGLDLKPPD